MQPKALFLLKYRDQTFGQGYGRGFSSGLWNSARFVHEMLLSAGVKSRLVHVVDGNEIDREIRRHQPTHVFIEALWVLPSKLEELQQLYPAIKWIVRIHSEIPFLANETVAIEWIKSYVQYPNVYIAANSLRALHDLRSVMRMADDRPRKVIYLPNFYPYHKRRQHIAIEDPDYVDVACFGAVRPMKNQLLQAITALEYATKIGKKLRFHINGTRTEQGGDRNLRNLRALFYDTDHVLVEYSWMEHKQFLNVLARCDVGMQISFSETFNIVAADMVTSRLPVVTSEEVPWIFKWVAASTTDASDMLRKLNRAVRWQSVVNKLNLWQLTRYCKQSRKVWLRYLHKEC